MDRGAGMREAGPTSADAALVEAARSAPAALFRFRLSPSGTYGLPFVSPDFAARYGFEQGEPEETAARFFSRIHPDDLTRVQDAIARSGRTLETFEFEFRFRIPSGEEVWAEARSNPERTADGGVLWNGIATDITERKRAETNAVRLRAELEEALAWQRQIFEGSRDAVFLSDEEGRFVAVNQAATELTGFSREELLAMRIPDLHDESDLAAYRTFQRRILDGERILSEAPIQRKGGGKVAVEFNNSVVVIGGKRFMHTAGRDITERTAAEAALRTSEEQFRAMFDFASVGVAQGDPKTGRLSKVNPKLCLITGYSAEELLTRRFSDITHPDDRERDWTLFERTVTTGGSEYQIEKRYMRKDGSIVWANVNVTVLRDAMGAPTRTIALIMDITERKKAEEASARFLAGSPAVIYALSLAPGGFRVSWFSENLHSLTGYTHAEVRAGDPQRWWEQSIHPDDLPRVVAANQAVLDEGQATVEFRFRRKDGSWLWVHDEKRVLFDPENRPSEVVGSWMDVTARVRLEEQLRQAQKMEAVGQLAGGVAHDFNNLLTVISGNCDLLLSGARADDPTRGPLTDIRAAGERAANLTRQLLAFSRKQILEPRLVDVHEVVTGIENMLRRLLGEDVELLTNLAADPSWVKVDPGQLEQVVMNLAVNARDAMPRGGRLTIRTQNVAPSDSIDPEETAGRRLRPKVALSISDTGTGILPEVKAHLFEPFFTTKGVGKGTGLGLATVFGIVKQSGGDIMVESEPGKGATFTVILPSQPAPRRRSGSGASHRAVPRGTETVLAVEDEDAVRRIVKIALESAGYRVIEARNGLEALEAARTHSGEIHLVVTDVVMPEMSGRELVERIVKDHPGVRILYMSGYTDDAVMRHGIVESGVAFLQKPFTPLALARKVREVLNGKAV